MPSIRTVHLWVQQDREGFGARYRDARETGCSILAEQMLQIADDISADRIERRNKDGTTEFVVDQGIIKRALVRINTRQWLLSKMLPKRFGDRPNPDTEHDLNAELAEMMKLIDGRTRGLPSEDVPLDMAELNQRYSDFPAAATPTKTSAATAPNENTG
jgi:terminase small subunit-like protein